MSGELGYDEGARWLLSDGSIIGKVQRTPDPQGIRLTLDMPFGDPVVAILVKLNASSMSEFCELARGTYNERKAEQAAQSERASRKNEDRKAELDRETALPAVQTTVEVNPLDPASITSRLVEIAERVTALSAEVKRLDAEGNMLYKIMEVLTDASNDDEETDGRVQTTTPSPNEGEGAESTVDQNACAAQLHSNRAAGAGQVNSGLGLPRTVEQREALGLGSLPDTEAETSQDGSFHEEADVDADLTKSLKGDADPL